jgi:uncharacterized protein (TIGR00255 family)
MTGFGRAAGTASGFAWTWELKSVNGRTLDLRLRLPAGYDHLEPAVRKAIGRHCRRGSVQATLALERGATAGMPRINEDLLLVLLRDLNGIADRHGLPPVDMTSLLQVRGVIENVEGRSRATAPAAPDEALLASLDEAAVMLRQSRETEGAALARMLEDQLAVMAATLDEAVIARDAQSDLVRERLAEQVREFLANSERLDPVRLHQEAALLATKADVREELDRFTAHIAAARDLLRQHEPIGRRLDFLAQEFGREANTTCSKAGSMALTEIGLKLKSLVEQFREQVQNVE